MSIVGTAVAHDLVLVIVRTKEIGENRIKRVYAGRYLLAASAEKGARSKRE